MVDFLRSHENKDNVTVTAIVIDDDKDTVSVLSDFLQIKGITVIGEGYDGLEAIEIYKTLRPDVVFLDVMMKEYDGIYTLEKIREIEPDAIVILITADLQSDTRNRLLELNASAIIYKPYDINEVMCATNELVLKLKQKLLEDLVSKKSRLRMLNTILKKRLQNSEMDVIRRAQYFEEKEKLI